MSRSGSITATQVRLASPDEMARFCAVANRTPLDPATLAASGGDEHWLLADDTGAMARCSLWYSTAPAYQ